MHNSHRPRARIGASGAGTVVATVDVADGGWARMIGLLSRTHLESGSGLLLKPCCSIHTCFMRFSIDVLFLTDDGEVVGTFDRLGPWRFVRGGKRARLTLELPAGARLRAGIALGNKLRIVAI